MARGKPGSRVLLGGLVLLAVGMATLVTSVVTGSLVTGISQADEHEVPATFTEQLEPGEYLISLKFATTRSAGPISFTRSEAYNIVDIDVTDPTGQPVALQGASNQTVKRGATSYAGVSTFEATTPGVYTIHLESDRPTAALVTPALNLAAFREAATMGGGLVLGALGLTLAIWGYIRRRDAGRPPVTPPPPAAPPPPRASAPPPWAPPPPSVPGTQLPYR